MMFCMLRIFLRTNFSPPAQLLALMAEAGCNSEDILTELGFSSRPYAGLEVKKNMACFFFCILADVWLNEFSSWALSPLCFEGSVLGVILVFLGNPKCLRGAGVL